MKIRCKKANLFSDSLLSEKVLSLSPVERIQLIETILVSLDKPDSSIDQIWIEEAEKRYSAYKEGKLTATSWEVIKERYK